MSDNKKYYYLKLKENFFDNEAMIMLQNMPNGYVFSDILMKLYLRSLKNDGKLMLNDSIFYTPKMLATITRHKEKDVKNALKIFQELGLIEMLENGAIYMLELQNFIGESSTQADRKRAYREKIVTEKSEEETFLDDKNDGICPQNGAKMSQKKVDICPQNVSELSQKSEDKSPPELEIEIEKEIKKELEIEIKKELEKEIHQEKEFERQNRPRVWDTSGTKMMKKKVVELLLKNGSSFSVTENLAQELKSSYPEVDVVTELLKMQAWCQANPSNRKTKEKIMRFITGWLSRASERTAPRNLPSKMGKSGAKKGDYSGDYEDLGEWPDDVI